ncbi:predicted protein [Uncinocarpus reesii 1704]|uniref:Uncharacterized protein n=1 Tax=Uncinocarpus reesii (strain UAMH 1704) TaxID=336963 RepID=C4JFT6_UNCRE|nr:uncharacterized protein UREG_02420 [Uncinocarpus reesii 1704]EEP77571.1 predicted protein [Uncinocarpus reesii 1704]
MDIIKMIPHHNPTPPTAHQPPLLKPIRPPHHKRLPIPRRGREQDGILLVLAAPLGHPLVSPFSRL